MNIHIIATRAEDETYQKNKEIFLKCQAENLPLPDEIEEYFNFAEKPEEVLQVHLKKGEHYEPHDGDMEQGFDIVLKNLPPDVVKVRFYVSY